MSAAGSVSSSHGTVRQGGGLLLPPPPAPITYPIRGALPVKRSRSETRHTALETRRGWAVRRRAGRTSSQTARRFFSDRTQGFSPSHDAAIVTERTLHVHSIAAPNGANLAPTSAGSTPAQAELALSYDLTCERGCRTYARELACRTVMAMQAEVLTKDAAIQVVSRRYRLGTFLLKLWKNEPVVIRADKLRRLELAYDDARRSLSRKFG